MKQFKGCTAFAVALLAGFATAQSACQTSVQQYNDLPGFPASNTGCYPLGYSSAADLGVTSPDNAATRCTQQCNSLGAQCAGFVAQVNKAADSNNYSGTCFFYPPNSLPTGPRQCGDKAYLLIGRSKDNTLGCFSQSSVSATQFCSSYLGIPIVTVMVTTTPSTATFVQPTTTTGTVSLTSTATSTTTTSTTTTVPTTTTVATVTSSSTTRTTTTTATTTTTTSFTTSTQTFSTLTAQAPYRRAVSTVPPPACVTSGTPSTRLSAACSCLSVSTSTTTLTMTAATPTSTTATTISSKTTTTSFTTIVGATVTSSLTSTTTASISITTLTTSTSTLSTSTTTTTISTSTATSPAVIYCGVRGSNNGNGRFYNSYPYAGDGYACQNGCLANPMCKTFLFGLVGGSSYLCNYYTTTPNQLVTSPSPNSPYYYYQRECTPHFTAPGQYNKRFNTLRILPRNETTCDPSLIGATCGYPAE